MANEQYKFEENVECTLSDGTILRSDIYRPKDNEKYPVLMLRLPYNKKTKRYYDEYLDVPRMVDAGYVVILQDVRGRFASDGEFYPFVNEGKDGYDAVEWAAKLPYANGKVGLFGMSYHGYTQLAATVKRPPSLKAIAPVMIGATPWPDMLNEGVGATSVGSYKTWVLGSIVEDQLKRRKDSNYEKVQSYLDHLAESIYDSPADDWKPMKDLDPESFYFDAVNGGLGADFKQEVDLIHKIQDLELPALFMGGWYDALLTPTIKAYNNYGGPKNLWIGPWTHEEMTGHAGAKFFENAAENIGVDQLANPTEVHIKWFDHWLKDQPNPIEKPIHLYLMGQKKWEAYQEWPPDAEVKELYLDSKGHSQTRNGDGQLVKEPSTNATESKLKLDPQNAVPTSSGGALIAGNESGTFDIGEIQDRDDVLVYTGVEQEEDLNILGTVKASVWVSSPTPLMDISIRITDVEPSGEAYNIMETYHREKVDEVNQPFCIQLEIGHTAYLLKKGHRLRVDIAASNTPTYDINLNNGKTTKTDPVSSGQIAFERIYHGGDVSSKITLPVSK